MKRSDFRNSSLTHLANLASQAAATLPAGSRVLDAGAGNAPYRDAFNKHDYHTVDISPPALEADRRAVANLNRLPLRSDSYDLVFSSQVLEHVPDPATVLGELWRVLREGASMWVSVPFFYAEHEQPHDYFRFTQFGLTQLCTDVGFEVQSIRWLEGYLGTLAYQTKEAALNLNAAIASGALDTETEQLARETVPAMADASNKFADADLRTLVDSVGLPINYVLVATKPVTAETESGHWADLENYRASWAYRTEFMADFVTEGTTVVEFGAGEGRLEALLPAGCVYRPADIVSRGEGSFVCDLNVRPLPALPPGDIAFFSGVLEYVNNLAGLVEALRWNYETIIMSYVTADHLPPGRRDPRWRHAMTWSQISAVFDHAGFVLTDLRDIDTQNVAVFKRRPIAPGSLA